MYGRARDEEERRGVRVYTVTAVSLILLFLATTLVAPQREPVTAMFLVAFLGFGWLSFVHVPRITARRRAAEVREDPGAAARQARDRRYAIIGWLAGGACGSLPIIWLWLRQAPPKTRRTLASLAARVALSARPC